MKLLVIGNCQARPVSQLLGLATGADMLEPIILHLARPEDASVHEQRMQEADLIFTQWTQDTFSPVHVASSGVSARYPGRTLIWPNLFYAGQQPWLRYVTHARLGRILGPLDTYHDLRILGEWYQARTGHNPLPEIAPDAVARGSLAELRLREAGCDLAISDLIEAEAARRPLFFTFNHPANWLLHRLVQRICDRAGLSSRSFVPPPQEFLGRIVPPSVWHGTDSDFPLQGLRLDQDRSGIHQPGPPERLDLEQLRALSFTCYDRQVEALQDHGNLRLTPQMPPAPTLAASAPAPVSTVPSPARESILFETENLVCILHDRGGDHLVVTFGEMMFRPSGTRIWAEKPLKSLEISAIGFVAKAANWFPEVDMRKAIERIAMIPDLGRFLRRTGYGFSMGAYAVLKYGKALSLTDAIAVSPQVSIDPQDIEDPRFNVYFDQDLNRAMRISADDMCRDSLVIFDPNDRRDHVQVQGFGASAPVSLIRLRNTGHAVLKAFAGTEPLVRLLAAARSKDLPSLNAFLQEKRRRAPGRPLLVALQATKRHKEIALRIFKARCADTDPAAWGNILLPLCQAGYGAQVQDELSLALDKAPENPPLLLAQAVACHQAGDEERALAFAHKAHRLRPSEFSTFFIERGSQRASGDRSAIETQEVSPVAIENKTFRNIMLYWADEPPPSVRAVVEQWRAVYADWNVTLFSRSAASAWLGNRCGAEIARMFDACRLPAMQADFFRVFWAIEEGGIYSDVTFAPLVCPGIEAIGKELVLMRRFHGRIVNSIFYAARGSADLKKVAYHILRAMSLRIDQNVWSATGPGAWIEALGQEETPSIGIMTDQEMYQKYVRRSDYEASTRGSSLHWSQDQKSASIYLD